jgi:hypothetical protein
MRLFQNFTFHLPSLETRISQSVQELSCGLDAVRFPARIGILLLATASRQPRIQWVSGDTRETINYREQWRSHQWSRRLNSPLEMVHTLSGHTARFTTRSHRHIQIKSNKSEYGQLYIFNFAEATTNQLENQSSKVCLAEVMQRLEMRQQVNPFAESYKRMHQIK